MRPDPTFFDPPVSNQECEEFYLPEAPFSIRRRIGWFALALAAIFGGTHYTSVYSVKNNRLVETGEVQSTEFQALALPNESSSTFLGTDSCFVFSGTLPLAEPITVSLASLPAELPELPMAMTEQDYLAGLGADTPIVQIDDLLTELKKEENFPDCDIEVVCQKLMLPNSGPDQASLKSWIEQAKSGEGGINLAIAARFSDAGDHDAAFAFYERSMDETHSPEAYFQVGAAQLFGLGTPTNFSLAQMNLFMAQREDHAGAAYLLGTIYLSGVCGSVNEAHAYRFFQIAIEKGNRLACGEAGRMRETGRGVSRDLSRAQELYREGAESGEIYCIKQLIRLESQGQLDRSIVTPAEVADYQVSLPAMHDEELSLAARQLLPGGWME